MMYATGKKHKQIGESKGFTLLELLIVISMIGILILTAIPSFKGTYKNLKISLTAKEMASLITYARQKAVLERTKYKLNLDYQGKKYWLSVEKDPINYPDYYVKSGKVYCLPEEFVMNSYLDAIIFYPDGRVNIGVLTLRDEESREYILTFGTRINYVKIYKKDMD
ncbi:MAG: prepilin-type N-terminal cleavage/methylation domain-containing protein [bacterium]